MASHLAFNSVDLVMSDYIGIQLGQNTLDLVRIKYTDTGLAILASQSHNLKRSPETSLENQESDLEVSANEEIKNQISENDFLKPEMDSLLRDFAGEDEDWVLLPVVLNTNTVSFHKLDLPFGDKKRLEQTVPLQVQDSVPFEVDEFLCSNLVLDTGANGNYNILSALISDALVPYTIKLFESANMEAKALTVPSAACSGFVSLLNSSILQEESLPTFVAIVSLAQEKMCLTLVKQSSLFDLREFEVTGLNKKEIASEIKSFLLQLKLEQKTSELEVFVVLPELEGMDAKWLSEDLKEAGYKARAISLRGFLEMGSKLAHQVEHLLWALSLAEEEHKKGEHKQLSLNLRCGPYAYHEALEDIIAQFREESFWFGAAVLSFGFWLFVQFYVLHSRLSSVESQIQANINQVFQGEVAPVQGEVPFVEDRLTKLEEQLRGLGSISSLSPLESLRELSETIPPNVDMDVDSLNIGYSKITMRGSVADHPSVGTLEGALKRNSNRFIANVSPQGRDNTTSRVKYSAEVEIKE